MTGAAAMVAGAGLSAVMTATIPPIINGSAKHAPVTCDPVTVVVSGGTGPYTYLWSQTVATPETWTISDPASASTSFTCLDGPDDSTVAAFFHCDVADSAAATARSNEIEANATATASTGGA